MLLDTAFHLQKDVSEAHVGEWCLLLYASMYELTYLTLEQYRVYEK